MFGRTSRRRRSASGTRFFSQFAANGGGLTRWRGVHLEPLEARQMLAFGHTFVDINPDFSDLDATDPDAASMGRVGGLANVAGDNGTYYAASEFGGLFKSSDLGLTWDHLDGHIPQTTWDVEVDPSNPNRVYATSFYDARVNPITGIQVSTDAGATWSHPLTSDSNPLLEGTAIDNTPQAGYFAANARRTSPAAYGISIRPDATNNVAIGTNAGVAISNDSGATWQIIDPLLSTNPASSAANIWDAVWQPGGPMGMGILDVVGDTGHHRSVDGGANWTANNLPGGAFGASGSSLSIAASPDESYVLYVVGIDNQLYESLDAGATWTQIGATDPVNGGGRLPFVTTNDTTAGFDVWTGGVSLYRAVGTTPAMPAPGGASRITAPGAWFGGFTRGGIGNATGAHDDVGDIVFDSQTAVDAVPRLYSSDGGVYFATVTSAAPTSFLNLVWEQPIVGPHALWLFGMASLDQPGLSGEDIYFGTQDAGVFASINVGSNSPTWHMPNCCDAFDFAANNAGTPNDRTDDTIVFDQGSFAMGRQFPFRLGDSGLANAPLFNDPADYPDANTTTPSFNFGEGIDSWGNNQFAIVMNDGAPNDGGLFITSNITNATGGGASVTWTELGNATEPASNNFGDLQVAVGGGTPSFFVTVGDGNGYTADQLWRFTGTNPAGVWQRLDTNIGGGATGVSQFAVDPNNPNRLYASAISAAGPRMVFSTDGGTNWQNDTNLDFLMTGGGAFQYSPQRGPRNFPDQENSGAPARGVGVYFQPTLLAFDPEDPSIIAAGAMDAGVFLSTDSGGSWRLLTDPFGTQDDPTTTLGNGLPLDDVPHISRPRFAHFDHESGSSVVDLYVGTQGRGVWRIEADFNKEDDVFDLEDLSNDTIGTATVLGSPEEVNLRDLSIHDENDVDFYQYTANETGKLVINTIFDTLLGDLDVRVRDARGNIIATGIQTNIAPQQDTEQIVIPVVSQQRYFIEVFSAAGHTNCYDLEIENFAAPVPSGVHLDPSSDTGMMNNDNVTNDNTPRLIIQADLSDFAAMGIDVLDAAEAAAMLAGTGTTPGAAVELFITNSTTGVSTRGFADPIGTSTLLFEFTPGLPLFDGVYFVSAAVRMFDGQLTAAGTPAPATGRSQLSAPLWITIDTLPPDVPGITLPDLLASSDTGMFNDDNVTSKMSPAFDGLGPANAKVRVRANGVVVGQGVVNSDQSDGVPGNGLGIWEVTVEPLDDGIYTITAEFEDAAGNIFSTTELLGPGEVPLPQLVIEIDTVAPNTPLLDLLAADDSGRSNEDDITNDQTPRLDAVVDDPNGPDVSAMFPNGHLFTDIVKYRIFDRIDTLPEALIFNQAAFVQNGAFLNLVALINLDGAHGLKLEVEDRAGNLSHDFLLEILLDRVAPAAPAIAIDPATSDTGIEGQPLTIQDRITSDTTTGFVGTAEADAIVRMWADGVPAFAPPIAAADFDVFQGLTVAIPLDGNVAFPLGQWNLAGQFDLNDPNFFPFIDGVRQISVTAEDVAGNESSRNTPGQLDIFIDTRGPQIDDIFITDHPAFDLFAVKAEDTLEPTPLAFSLDVVFKDEPVRVDDPSVFVYPAVNQILATTTGNYTLVGDATGAVTITEVLFNDMTAAGNIGMTTVTLVFDEPLPDDRFTLVVSDRIKDDPGNALDGEPNGADLFRTGNGDPGEDFVGRFTIDSRHEIGTFSAGTVSIDINGNYIWDPQNVDQTNRDITFDFHPAFATDVIFAGNFDNGGVADGFEKLAAYGKDAAGNFRWLIDVDNDGVPDQTFIQPPVNGVIMQGLPVAGNFDGNAANGDEVGLFIAGTWYLDSNANNVIDAADTILAGNMFGFPIVGDFDGDRDPDRGGNPNNNDDLATWQNGRFFFDLLGAADGSAGVLDGLADATIDFDFEGVSDRPVAGDVDGDGVDDVGLYVPGRSTQLPLKAAEWYFLVSGDYVRPEREIIDEEIFAQFMHQGNAIPGTVNLLDHPFTPEPFGNDIFAQFADEFSIPVVGNFDPPANVGGGTTQPGDVMANWLNNLYNDMLGRDYAASEFDYYSQAITSGAMNESQVAMGFLSSFERRANFINGWYEKYLGRGAEAAGKSYWNNIWTKHGAEVVEASLIGSAEFYQANGGTDQGWIQGLYNHILGRGAAQFEVDYWKNVIQSTPRTNVALGFLTSDEFRLGMINSWYQLYLRRDNEPAGAQFWLAQLKQGTRQEQIQSGILASQEYQNLII